MLVPLLRGGGEGWWGGGWAVRRVARLTRRRWGLGDVHGDSGWGGGAVRSRSVGAASGDRTSAQGGASSAAAQAAEARARAEHAGSLLCAHERCLVCSARVAALECGRRRRAWAERHVSEARPRGSACDSPARRLEALDQFLDLPYFNVGVLAFLLLARHG